MRMSWSLCVVFSLVSVCAAQVIYEPVRYQHGATGATFYGGIDASMPYSYPHFYTPGVQALTDKFGYASPYRRPLRFDVPNISYERPSIFTDLQPYVDVAPYGFTQDDARNEAYANMPRIQTRLIPSQLRADQPVYVSQSVTTSSNVPTTVTRHFAVTESASEPAGGTQVTPERSASELTNSKAKAVPLLSWARAERERNPALFNALIREASKLDPDSAAKLKNAPR
jgi:hypothetical protein